MAFNYILKRSPRSSENADGSLTIKLEDGRSQEVDCLIWAIGRHPATDTINLEASGVETNARGFVKVDKYQNTNVEGIYAVGDIIEGELNSPSCRGCWTSFI